jgi:hypothetical protein
MQLYVDVTDDKPRENLQDNSKLNCADTEEVSAYVICISMIDMPISSNKFFHTG